MALGIAFEGCAGRSAFSAGVAMGLDALGALPGLAAGASSGAIVAAFVGAGRTEELESTWLEAAGQRVFQPEALLRLKWPLRMSELVGRAMETAFGPLRLDELPRPVAIPVTHLGAGGRTLRVLTHRDPVPVARAVLASCFIPGPYSRVVRIDGRVAFDGAWQWRTPLGAARAIGARRIVAVSGHPRDTLARDFPRVRQHPLPEDCRLIRPDAPLALGGYDTDAKKITAAMEAGRRAAERFLDRERRWLSQGA